MSTALALQNRYLQNMWNLLGYNSVCLFIQLCSRILLLVLLGMDMWTVVQPWQPLALSSILYLKQHVGTLPTPWYCGHAI